MYLQYWCMPHPSMHSIRTLFSQAHEVRAAVGVMDVAGAGRTDCPLIPNLVVCAATPQVRLHIERRTQAHFELMTTMRDEELGQNVQGMQRTGQGDCRTEHAGPEAQ